MKLFVRGALGALVCTASVAGAQRTPATTAASSATPACDVGAGSGTVAKATLFLQRAAQEVQGKQDASKDLKQAIAALTTPDKGADSVARAYYLGQAYILMLQQPGVMAMGPRSSYGIASNPAGTVDLYAAADSAFTLVENTHPACKAELAGWRQQKPWLDVMNGAITALNAQQYDSAAALAKRALEIDRRAPYAYSVLAAVANQRKDYTTAATMLQQAISAAAADTVYADARLGAMYDLGNNLTLQASAGTAQRPLVDRAVKAWEAYIAAAGPDKDPEVAHALAAAGQLLQQVKDTVMLAQVYAPVLAAPAKYGEQALLNAGVLATRAGRPADAARMFEAVLAQNPNERDALKNLSASYVGTGQPQRIIPLVNRLVVLDPNNADNWLLYAYAYSGMLKGTKDPRLTKAYSDSLVKYNTKADKLTPRVVINSFMFGQKDNSVTLAGRIENQGTAAKSATMQVEFLDKSGNVVGTGSTTVGPIPSKGAAPFTVTAQAPNAVAYRYRPLA